MRHGESVQFQLPRSAQVPTAQPPLMNVSPSREQNWAQQERQSLQQSDPRRGIQRSSVAQTSSTRVSTDVLSYATPPEARRPPLPSNTSRPQSQNYFSPQHPAGGIPLQTQPSTQGDIARSVPANYPLRLPSTAGSPQTPHVHDFSNQPPGYSTEMRNNVQEHVGSTTPHREKHWFWHGTTRFMKFSLLHCVIYVLHFFFFSPMYCVFGYQYLTGPLLGSFNLNGFLKILILRPRARGF